MPFHWIVVPSPSTALRKQSEFCLEFMKNSAVISFCPSWCMSENNQIFDQNSKVEFMKNSAVISFCPSWYNVRVIRWKGMKILQEFLSEESRWPQNSFTFKKDNFVKTSKNIKLICSRIPFWRNQMTREFLSGQKIPTFISTYIQIILMYFKMYDTLKLK